MSEITEVLSTYKAAEAYLSTINKIGGVDADTYALMTTSFSAEDFAEIDSRLVHEYPTATYESYACGVLRKIMDASSAKYADIIESYVTKAEEMRHLVKDAIWEMRSYTRKLDTLLSSAELSEITISPTQPPYVRIITWDDGEGSGKEKRISVSMLPVNTQVVSAGALGKMSTIFNIDTAADGTESILKTFAHQLVVGKINIEELYNAFVMGQAPIAPVLYSELINSNSIETAISNIVDIYDAILDSDYYRDKDIRSENDQHMAVSLAKAVSVFEWLFGTIDNKDRTIGILFKNTNTVVEELSKFKG